MAEKKVDELQGISALGISDSFNEAVARNPHLAEYLRNIPPDIGQPTFVPALDMDMYKLKSINLLYPVGDPIFIHLYQKPDGKRFYQTIEPQLTEKEADLYKQVETKLVSKAQTREIPEKVQDVKKVVVDLMDECITFKEEKKSSVLDMLKEKKIFMTPDQYDKVKYFLLRDRFGYGKIESLLRDPYLEDIHCIGVGRIYVVHKIFLMLPTNLIFKNDLELNKYIFQSSERVESPVSEAKPIVDAIMPDGSRVNFLYGREISLRGSSFTIRKFTKVPISITQLIGWKTISPELAAYLWLSLENGMNIFVCGETAAGKTTTLNAMSVFIKPDAKVFSVEETPEVTMPHPAWQHLVTRLANKESDVTMYDLLRASLRSRPNYIIVGEIRGAEGHVAFQAMQTGHPVCSTFHSGSIHQMIQRLTGHPIDVPISFIDNLNSVLIQRAVYMGGRYVRRVVSVTEIERYYDELNKVATSQVFSWDNTHDKINFRGRNNSYILEEKVAKSIGYDDPRDIYKELDKRSKILRGMVDNGIFNYFDVWDVIKNYYEGGEGTLPFRL